MNPSTNSDNSRTPPIIQVKLFANQLVAQSFTELFQKGFVLTVEEGATIRDVVTGPLKVDSQYLDGRINTVFLNGQTVDNVDTARVGEGAVLSLSASMPGFVGAALRKGGFYAVMRAEITHAADRTYAKGCTSQITVRLYNLVARELGPFFLTSSVQFPRADLVAFLAARSQAFWKACAEIVVDNHEVDAQGLQHILASLAGDETLVSVQVITAAPQEK